MDCPRCVGRREFLARASSGLGLAAAAAACGDGIVSGVSPVPRRSPNVPPTESVTVVVANFPQLATEGVLVQVSSFFAAKRTGPATFDAFSMACTHEGCLTEITNGEQFDCPCHFSRFASDGSVLRGPARQPLQKLTTSFDPGTGILTIN